MKYDSVLDQQSISGKIVSLILCVWKPCHMKSGHKFRIYYMSFLFTGCDITDSIMSFSIRDKDCDFYIVKL